MQPDIDELYAVLRDWAVASSYDTYTALSHAYRARTGDWHEPHGSWDAPLGELNRRIHVSLRGPALSALVVLRREDGSKGQPGGKFWASAPNVPSRPSTEMQRLAEWSRIVKEVHAFPWPQALP